MLILPNSAFERTRGKSAVLLGVLPAAPLNAGVRLARIKHFRNQRRNPKAMNESLNLDQDPQKLIVSLTAKIVTLEEKISALESTNAALKVREVELIHLLSLVLIEDGTLVDPADRAKHYCNVCKSKITRAIPLTQYDPETGWYCASCRSHFKAPKKQTLSPGEPPDWRL
ncbi:hypothetical protein MTYM_02317 [Methylococcales bacterium]|nr:hypothetical protein MTYM_02317 [Methylococcales bacterium]